VRVHVGVAVDECGRGSRKNSLLFFNIAQTMNTQSLLEEEPKEEANGRK
jgi:hypothetical protein